MILNVVDRRTRQYRWKKVNAILENAWQDNGCTDADQARKDCEHQLTYAAREDVSVSDAISWGMEVKAEVTLYLYDTGAGTTLRRHVRRPEIKP